MGFGIFFHDFHMSGSGIRSHTFATMKTKQIQTSNFGGSHLYGCHRHVANKTNSCSQVCAVFVSTKCTPNKKSQYFEYWKNIISIKFFGFCGFFHILIFIDILTHAPYSNHTQNTPYVVVSFCSCGCLQMFSFPVPNKFPVQVEVVNLKRELSDQGDSIEESRSLALVSLQVSYHWEVPHISPKPPQSKIILRKILVKGLLFFFQGVCGWDFET